MGYYINRTSKRPLEAKGKADMLIADGDAVRYAGDNFDDLKPDECFVCVVNNGPFEAAAIAYDQRELAAFRRPDSGPRPRQEKIGAATVFNLQHEYERRGEQRPRVWLVMKKEAAIALSDEPEYTRRAMR